MYSKINRLVSLLFFLCLSATGYAQKKKKPPPTPFDVEVAQPEKTRFTKFSLSKRLSFFPFNKATQIQLVSFGLKTNGSERKDQQNHGLPITGDTINFRQLDQRKSLTMTEIDSLSDLLYNTCTRWKNFERSKMGCFNPRNAILFFDTAGKVFEYIEICFECHDFKVSSKKVKTFEECDPFYEEAKAYFNRLGLETSELPIRIPPPPPEDKR